MSDIKVTIGGDASGAKEAFSQVGHALEEISSSMGKSLSAAMLLEKGFEKLTETIKEGFKESIEAYAQEEVTLKQLTAATGENAAAFRAQAEAFKEHLGVSDDMVMHMTTLASRFGTLPSQIEPATKAILDWSAITGNDATSGMQALVRAVDFGQGKVKSLGIEFEVSADKAETMKNAIAALNEKFGGGAENVADSLHGRMAKTKEATEDLEKAFGSMFDSLDRKLGILDKAKLALKGWTLQVKSLTGGGGEEEAGGVVDGERGQMNGGISGVSLTSDLSAVGKGALGAGVGSQGAEMLAYQRKLAGMKTAQQEIDDFYAKEDQEAADRDIRNVEHAKKAVDDLIKEQQEGMKATMAEEDKKQRELDAIQKKQWDAEYRIHEKEEEDTRNHLKKLAEIAREEGKKFKDEMMSMGAKIGEALTSTLATALEAAINGGEFDVVGAMEDLGFAVATIAGTAIGTIYGNAAVGQAIGTGIAAIGGIVHNENAKSWQASHPPAKRHEGGEIERFHSGGWPGLGSDEQLIIAQEGERMLSRQNVANMGGHAGVERAARGGGGGSVTVQAWDSSSMLETFRGRGARALYNAIRTGGSELTPLFGG